MLRALLAIIICLTTPAWAETRVPTSQAEISMGFTPVVKRAAPAVVNIYARRIVNVRSSPFAGDPFFQNLFNNFGVPQQRVQNSLGSGVILSEDGIVVSNYHVVGEATDSQGLVIRRGIRSRNPPDAGCPAPSGPRNSR
jgi:S1-C subfamily serine protease